MSGCVSDCHNFVAQEILRFPSRGEGGAGSALGHDIAPKRLMYTCVSVYTRDQYTKQEKRRNNYTLTRQQNIQKKKKN